MNSKSLVLSWNWQKYVVAFLILCILALSFLAFATTRSMSHISHFTVISVSSVAPQPLDAGGGGPW